ncbi:TetR/AcrR family transcriptional regulator [Streptomyces sp. NPDC091280]|uniref:TetR/AcrR family transcriptional regulator n=1 Tax=Streptomyces sp. NPDC091280 TaxID=3365984 RepID=UPI0037FFC7C3
MRDDGYEALTMEEVAARTGCGKATLYRWWDGKLELVVGAMRYAVPVEMDTIDTGSLSGDLVALMASESDRVAYRQPALIRGVAAAAQQNPDLLRALHDYVVEPQTAALRRSVQYAVDRGNIHPDCPALEFVPSMLFGAVMVRVLVEDQPPTRAWLASYIASVVLPALGYMSGGADVGNAYGHGDREVSLP